MKKIVLLIAALAAVIILRAQGVYQLWGALGSGGSSNLGVLFSTDGDGNNFHVRHQFSFFNSPGASPAYTTPVEYNGKLYGMTANGGANDKGVIFEWDPATNVYTKKIDFAGSNGANPQGSLTLSGGKFYGMTLSGGINNDGVIFEWDPLTNVLTKKMDFSSRNAYPTGSLTLSDGKLYGMTWNLGFGGVIFEWDPITNIYTIEYEFNNNDGGGPVGDLTLNGAKFYGMTKSGGLSGAGVIFEWDPVANIYTKKIDFDRTNGASPSGSLTLDGGKFYGMTAAGGIAGKGVIFEWDPITNIYTKKFDFDGIVGGTPFGGLTLNSAKFYGMTNEGGGNNKGVVFEWDPVSNLFSAKIDFGDTNGIGPKGDLTLGGDKFYGMTTGGGSNGFGAFFEWDPATNLYAKKIDFSNSTLDGVSPSRNVIQINGKLYGTGSGGTNNSGVIYEFNPATNVYSKKFDATNANPVGNNQLATSGGKLYGRNDGGGINNAGLIYEWNPSTNVYTKKIDFQGDENYNNDFYYGGLTPDGSKFYGMSAFGGINTLGEIYVWDTTAGTVTKLFDFDGNNGANAYGSLTLVGGKLYGRTGSGTSSTGEIFEFDPATNTFTKKVGLPGSLGNSGTGSLTLRDGKLYGETWGDGEVQKGAPQGYGGEIFEWDPSTNVYTKRIDQDSVGSASTFGNLTLGKNNKFYGMSIAQFLFEWDPETNLYTRKKELNRDGTEGLGSDFNVLSLAPAPVVSGSPGSCVSFPSITIDGTNNNKWVSIIDSLGNAVAEIKANGNNLGIVNASIYINNAAVREDGNKKLYLDRNITITPTVQPTSVVNIRLYIKGSEFLALKNALNSTGDSSGARSINDVEVYKNGDNCAASVSTALANPLATTAETWQGDYVLSTSISSFSSFYFAGKTQTCPGPVIQCTADTIVDAKANRCGAEVKYKAPVVTDNCENVTLKQTAGLHSGAFFPVGTTINKFVATSSSGKKDSCSFTVTVKDKKPPFITPVFAYPSVLWPPNHQLKNVGVSYFAWDNCGSASCSLDVSSDEPVTGTGYGDRAPDWKILDDHHVKLRAERSVHGNGRTYTITVTCTDVSGNTSTQKTRVFVPRELHGHHSKDTYDFDEDNKDLTDGNGNYYGHLFDCKVLPNPSRQNFTLEIKSVSDEKIEVNLYDITGRFISNLGTVKSNTLRFGDNLRPRGVYGRGETRRAKTSD